MEAGKCPAQGSSFPGPSPHLMCNTNTQLRPPVGDILKGHLSSRVLVGSAESCAAAPLYVSFSVIPRLSSALPHRCHPESPPWQTSEHRSPHEEPMADNGHGRNSSTPTGKRAQESGRVGDEKKAQNRKGWTLAWAKLGSPALGLWNIPAFFLPWFS